MPLMTDRRPGRCGFPIDRTCCRSTVHIKHLDLDLWTSGSPPATQPQEHSSTSGLQRNDQHPLEVSLCCSPGGERYRWFLDDKPAGRGLFGFGLGLGQFFKDLTGLSPAETEASGFVDKISPSSLDDPDQWKPLITFDSELFQSIIQPAVWKKGLNG